MNSPTSRRAHRKSCLTGLTLAGLLLGIFPTSAHASIFHGETLDKVADVLTWIVLIVAPVVGLLVFLAVHILPEKIAEQRHHPQAKAIQCLCLLSLVFGGLLWPLAWLWAFSKPVLYKLAYGTDRVAPEHETTATPEHATTGPLESSETEELRRLYQRVGELESKLARKVVHEEKERKV